MHRDYKGKKYFPLAAGSLPTGVPLAHDLYIFLPLNEKMLKVRERGQLVTAAALQRYLTNGHSTLFSLDEISIHAQPADTSPLEARANLPASPAFEAPPPLAISTSSAPISPVEVKDSSVEESGLAPDVTQPRPEALEEIPVVANTTLDNLSEAKAQPASEVSTVTPAAEADSLLQVDESDIAEPSEELVEITADIESVTSFGSDAEEEVLRLVKGGSKNEPLEEEAKKIFGDIENLEEALQTFSPDAKKFIEETRLLAENEETANDWVRDLSDNSAQPTGMSKEDKAAAKLAHTLGKKLGLLRQELNGASREDKPDEPLLNERRAELENQIKKLENTALILEAMDSPEPDKSILPDSLQGKDGLELLNQLGEELEDLKGTKLLNEEDARLLDAKVKKVKARDHAIHNEGVGKAKAQLAKKMAQLEKEGRVLAAEEKEAANKEVAQEVKKALVAAKISNRLTEKREALIQLLQKKPENKADRKANETKATELQTEIFNLNELSFAVEAGEALSAEEADTFAVTVDSRFSIAEGETAAEGAQRLAGELDALQKEVSSAKVRAAEAENSLMAEVNRGTTAVSAKPDAAPATLTASPIPQVSSLEKLAESVAEESAKPVQDPETLEKAKVALVEETTRAMVMVKVDKRLARMREDLGNLVAAKASSPVAKVEMEAQATALLKKIQGMEKMSNRLEQGENLSPEITSKFLAGTPLLASEPGETAAQSAARLAQTASQLRTEISQARRVSAQAEQKLQQSLEQSPLTELKKEAAKSADLERAENCVARQLKEFLTSGKNPDSQAVWEVKKIVAEDVQRATAGINIGKKLTSLGEELAAVDSYPSSPDTSQRRQKLQEDVLRLKSLAQAIDNGEPVSDKKFQPYVEELPKNFQISGEKVSPEEYEKVIQSIRDLNEEAVEVKRGAIEALKGLDLSPPAVNLSPVGPIGEPETLTSSPAEEDLKRMVSGDDGKLAQAGVYAATILRSFGYEKTEFEKDMVLAALLWRHPPEQVATGFSPTVTIFHQAAHDPQANTDILVQDLGQAIRLANLYVEMPGVITGKFSIDPEIFHRLCEDLKKSEPTDHENLERARQGIVSVLSESERAKLIALSKDAYQSVGKWKQTLSKAS